jgi:hypothetical protein
LLELCKMNQRTLNLILQELRSNRHEPMLAGMPTTEQILSPTGKTCVGGIIIRTFMVKSKCSIKTFDYLAFLKWMDMSDSELDSFAAWTEELFKQHRNFITIADLMEERCKTKS